MKSYTQYNLAQHSTAQHSTAQHSTAQHSTAAYCNLNKITIALSLFSSLFIPTPSYAESVSHLGAAIGSNSVAVGQDSLATSTSGVANGHRAIATGNNFTREELNTKKQENKTALNNVNNKQNQLNHTNNQLIATDNAITSLNTQITELSKQQDTIRDKIENRNTLLNEKSVIQSNLDNKNSEVSTAKTNLDRLQANGKKYSNFTDMLRTLDWNKLDGNNIDTSRNELANDLKNIVDTNFNELSDKYNQQDYRRVIDGFINRQAGYQGSLDSFIDNNAKSDQNNISTNINGLRNFKSSYKHLFNDFFYKTNLSEFNYIDNSDYQLELKENIPEFSNIENMVNFLGVSKYAPFSESTPSYFGTTVNNQNLATRINYDYLSSTDERDDNIRDAISSKYTQKTLNTLILQQQAVYKSNKNNEFNALSAISDRDENKRMGNGIIFRYKDAYLRNNINLGETFIRDYNKNAFFNYSTKINITFAFKKKDSNTEKIETLAIDGNIGIISKLKDITPQNTNLITSEEIQDFKYFYNYLVNDYKDKIDWNFDKSAINLIDYEKKLEKVINYNEKIDDVLNLYNEILNERKKANGGDLSVIENKTNELIRLKQEVLDGTNDITNFLAGIKLTYNKQWADYYLNYAKDETDALVSRINSELKLYDDKDAIAVDITNKIKEFTDAYNNAVQNRDSIQDQLNDLNRQIDNLALTTSEIAVDDLKRDKEQELAVRQADKERLEREKQEAENELERLKEILEASSLANLGQNSYAQGKDAFASGNDSIAIGTSSISTGTDAVAIGHQSQALATSAVALGKSAQVIANANKGVAIGDSAVVNHKNSVAIGAGSTTVRGAQAGPYNAPIGGELTDASFATGSIGEFSVGADGKLRQITHVAAGTADTDAVNVWQLTTAITKLKEALEQNPPAGPQGEPGPKGDKGDKGDTGAQGPQGERGEKGDTGAQGPQGERGEKGDTGAQGPQGERGEKGDTGAQGLKGDKGEKGDTGAQGLKGDKGDKGETGAQGLKGDKGDTGAAGPKGDKGDTGAAGPKGDKGDTGAAGPKGDKGDTGVAGPKGDKGDTGAAGPKGDKGDTGATGPKGDKGDTGATGPKGDKGDTGVAGPKGDKGDTGATGPKGDKGDTGVAGPKGDKGDTGAAGPKGDKGDTGVAGPKGDKGDTGATGPKGDKGDTGATGPKGDKGDTGAAGPKGDKGDTGATGPKGDKGDTGATGPKGDKGDTGAAGPKGDKGDTGATGPKGDKGDVGPQGPAGRDGIVGRVTTYTVSGKEKPDQEIVEAINQINSEGIKYVHVNDESAELPNENRINGDASASGRYAIAIGHLSEAIASDSIAVGHNAKANIVNSVALGSNAITVSEQTEYTAGTQSYTHSQAINRLNQMVHQFAGADAIGTVSLGKVGAERRVQHVAAGLISEKSTDAINGSQLHALATAIDKGQLGLVRQEYDENTIHNGVNHNRLTVGAGTGGQEVSFANAGGENRRLAGVAEGINANDAVNKGQLDRAVGKTISRINYIEKKLKGGVANAVAMAGLSQAYLPSQGLVSVGVGNYSGVSSIAVGMSHISDNGKVILRVGGSASQKGTAAASASVGFAW